MTRSNFRFQLFAIIASAASVIAICAVAKIKGWDALYAFFKDMSGYILLAVGPYIAYLFQRRSKFVEQLQAEWRKINEVKQDIVSYCQKGANKPEDYIDLYSALCVVIDDMRVLYRNVGESKEYIGYYPYETLHDFRKHLEAIDPRNGSVKAPDLAKVASHVISSFQAFRDVFLIELNPIAPDYPIIARNLGRLRKKGVDPRLRKDVDLKHQAVMHYFQIKGDPRPTPPQDKPES